MARPTPPVDTAWRRFQATRGRGAGPLASLLRRLEVQAPLQGLDPAGVTLAAEIAGLAPEADPPALTLLVLTALLDAVQGSTRTPLEVAWLTERFAALLGPEDPPGPWVARALAQLEGSAAGVIGASPEAYTPLIADDGALYLQRLLVAERGLAARLAARLAEPTPSPPAAALADVLARPAQRGGAPVSLSKEQVRAVEVAVSGAVTLVSGGPGTGKTSVVVAMLRALVRAGLAPEDLALAAPTGKAAWRMTASVRGALESIATPAPEDLSLQAALHPAVTLHRLLGYSPRQDRWRYHGHNPLEAAVVLVDEASMVDVFLMDRLVSALRPGARLVLLGDADQLPSVAAGAVFRDALEAAGSARVQLKHSYRMRADDPGGARILRVAERMNQGAVGLFGPELAVHRPELAGLGRVGVEHADLPRERRRAFLERWYRERVVGDAAQRTAWARQVFAADGDGQLADPALAAVFAWFEAARILCLTQGFELGARRINERLHERVARSQRQPAQRPFLVGEPVMVLQNDYARGLFNGDQGVVLQVEDADGVRPQAVFLGDAPGRYRAFALDALAGRLSLAYAMTVHKAQGSEFDAVALLLPERDLPLLTRELLYTALTRARRSVWVLGDRALLMQGVRRVAVRHAGLARRLSAPPTQADGL